MILSIISSKGNLSTEGTEFLYNNFLWVLCGEISVVLYFLLFFMKVLTLLHWWELLKTPPFPGSVISWRVRISSKKLRSAENV